jgi:hypothetical protein
MRLKGYFVWVFLCAAIASLLLIGNQPGALRSRATRWMARSFVSEFSTGETPLPARRYVHRGIFGNSYGGMQWFSSAGNMYDVSFHRERSCEWADSFSSKCHYGIESSESECAAIPVAALELVLDCGRSVRNICSDEVEPSREPEFVWSPLALPGFCVARAIFVCDVRLVAAGQERLKRPILNR